MRHCQKILIRLIMYVFMVSFTSCSLFKVSVSSGEPLPKEDAQLRILTRGFYDTFQKQAVTIADSIVNTSNTFHVRAQAIRWKMQTTRAVASAALESSPELAAVELWIFCKSLKSSLTNSPDSLLFSEHTPVVINMVNELEKRYVSQLTHILTDERMALMKEFVETRDYSSLTEKNQYTYDIALEWMEHLGAKGIEYKVSAGSISEAITDVGGKIEGYTNQFSNNLSWGKDLLNIEIQQDSIYEKIDTQLIILNREFERISMVMEDFPDISNQLLSNMNDQANQILNSFNNSVLYTFSSIDQQRKEVQAYISQERQVLLNDVQNIVKNSIQNVLNSLPQFLGKILGYILLFLIFLLGIPFFIGFKLGKMNKYKKNNQSEK